jgi:hypothetical protein
MGSVRSEMPIYCVTQLACRWNAACFLSCDWTCASAGALAHSSRSVLCNLMLRVHHCVECPQCRTRYLPGSSPYDNGSDLISLTEEGLAGWILYCSCGLPRACSEGR